MDLNLTDLLLSTLTIHVSGACGPHHVQPIECYYPVHHSYQSDALACRTAAATAAGSGPGWPPSPSPPANRNGGMRRLPSAKTPNGQALVYDRDIVTTWRLPSPLAAYEVFF